MKKITTLATILFINSLAFSQQISDGYASNISDFNLPLKSGVYNTLSPIGITPDTSHPWQHLFVLRHNNQTNNYQLQMASSFATNDRLFFRKIVGGDLSPVNTAWIELATRGTNTFTGNQSIDGNLGIGTATPNSKLTIRSGTTGVSINPGSGTNSYFGSIAFNRESTTGEIFDNRAFAFQINNGNNVYDKNLHFQIYNSEGILITNDALVINGASTNVGIGTTNPTSKLTVAGNIASREVKVTVDAGADFVFENDYNLPSLESVDKFINENKHLPEIASAEEMQKDGINLSEMNIKLLQKIEELTLYMIDMKKENVKQNEEIKILKNKLFSKKQ